MVGGDAPADPIPAAIRVARSFDACSIPYLVGGSIASTAYGEPRSTLNVAFAAHIEVGQVGAIATALREEFHLDESAIREAVGASRTFNLVHVPSYVRIDVHVRPRTGQRAEEIRRATPVSFGSAGEVRLATPEDTLLRKLWWYRLGDEVSERQWRDVLGMLKARPPGSWDRAYLGKWAADLGVADLLALAWTKSGLGHF